MRRRPPRGRARSLARALAGVGLLSSPAAAQDAPGSDAGVFADSIVFGQSAAVTGNAGELGRNMNLGIRAAFEEANRDGGVGGRALRLLHLDDRYEGELAVANTRELVARGVFALIGAVGTPTSRVSEPIASELGVPFVGAFTGASALRGEDQALVVNLRASYDQETEEMVERLTTDLGFERIAILHQDDSYGQAGLSGIVKALDRRGLALVGEGTYVRNTLAVKRALLDLRAADPEAIVIIGAYRAAAHFIKWARRLGMRSRFVNISFVGSNALLNELAGDGDGVVVTQVVPFPRGRTPVVARYRAALRAVDADAEPGFVSLEGYLAGRLVVEVLGRATGADGAPPTREAFVGTLREAGPIDLGGFEVEYGPGDNQGSDRVFLTVIRNGRFASVSRLSR